MTLFFPDRPPQNHSSSSDHSPMLPAPALQQGGRGSPPSQRPHDTRRANLIGLTLLERSLVHRGFRRTEEGTWISPGGRVLLGTTAAFDYARDVEAKYPDFTVARMLVAWHSAAEVPLPASIRAALQPWLRHNQQQVHND